MGNKQEKSRVFLRRNNAGTAWRKWWFAKWRAVDGRLFVVEYKGALTGQTDDTVEKTAIGKLWVAQDPTNCVYATIYGSHPNGMSVEQQLAQAFA